MSKIALQLENTKKDDCSLRNPLFSFLYSTALSSNFKSWGKTGLFQILLSFHPITHHRTHISLLFSFKSNSVKSSKLRQPSLVRLQRLRLEPIWTSILEPRSCAQFQQQRSPLFLKKHGLALFSLQRCPISTKITSQTLLISNTTCLVKIPDKPSSLE